MTSASGPPPNRLRPPLTMIAVAAGSTGISSVKVSNGVAVTIPVSGSTATLARVIDLSRHQPPSAPATIPAG